MDSESEFVGVRGPYAEILSMPEEQSRIHSASSWDKQFLDIIDIAVSSGSIVHRTSSYALQLSAIAQLRAELVDMITAKVVDKLREAGVLAAEYKPSALLTPDDALNEVLKDNALYQKLTHSTPRATMSFSDDI